MAVQPGDSTTMPGWTVDTVPPDGVVAGGVGAFEAGNGSLLLQLTGGGGETTGGGVHQTIAATPGAQVIL
jgi:hypothetical protein